METFVVRITEPAPGSGGGKNELHGVVEHLRSRESRPFQGSNQLLSLLADGVASSKHVLAEQKPDHEARRVVTWRGGSHDQPAKRPAE